MALNLVVFGEKCRMLYIKRFVFLLVSSGVWFYDCVMGPAGPGRKTCVALYYHHILPGEEGRFERQVETMVKLATPVRADWSGEGTSSGRHIILTFDDGFIHTLRRAIPVLERHEFPFTVFIPTAYIGKRAGWPDAGDGTDEDMVVSEQQLRDLLGNALFLPGSHAMTHRPLTQMAKRDAMDEIVSSRKALEKIAGKPVTLFSFPHGQFREENIGMCADAGYSKVFTIEPYLNYPGSKAYLQGRVEVDPKDWMPEFKLKILGCYRWRARASKWKRKFIGAAIPARKGLK